MQPDPELARLAPLLNAVLSLDLPDNEITGQMTGKVRADNTNDLLVRLLQSEARRGPLALVLEDAHWLDSASWALALLASQQLGPALVVIASRPLEEPPEDYRRLLQSPGLAQLRLAPLRARERARTGRPAAGCRRVAGARGRADPREGERQSVFQRRTGLCLA